MAQHPDRTGTKPRTGLRLMHVHAHPDDESSKGAASTAKYVAEGVDVHESEPGAGPVCGGLGHGLESRRRDLPFCA